MVEQALSNNWELQELYESLEESKLELPKVTFRPKNSTIQNILRYNSEQTALEPHL